MKKITTLLSVAAIALTINMTAGVALADDSDTCYEVTITNMTRGQVFTPVLVATHRKNVKLFTVGEAVNDELAQLAEGGDVVPLADLLGAMHHKVGAVAVADFDRPGGVFLPGESVQKMVLDAVQLKSATQRVMFDYRLPTDYFVGSKDSEP